MWGKTEATDPILFVVRNADKAEVLQKLFDPKHIFVMEAGGALVGRRFSAIINTVKPSDFFSEIEQMVFEEWCKEVLPLRLRPADKHKILQL